VNVSPSIALSGSHGHGSSQPASALPSEASIQDNDMYKTMIIIAHYGKEHVLRCNLCLFHYPIAAAYWPTHCLAPCLPTSFPSCQPHLQRQTSDVSSSRDLLCFSRHGPALRLQHQPSSARPVRPCYQPVIQLGPCVLTLLTGSWPAWPSHIS
jgi:hypothetical protein